MRQLVMTWMNDGTPDAGYTLPEGYSVRSLTEVENGIDAWLDIVQYGLSEKREDEQYYVKAMVNYPNYDPAKCFFVMQGGEAVATITVICDYTTLQGYIHMVACKDVCRGKGIGTLLNRIALSVLKQEGMKNARLTTDDWRIPAIKSYLRAGFTPDESTDEFKERWAKIREVL